MARRILTFFLSIIYVTGLAQEAYPVHHSGTIYSYGDAVTVYPEGFVQMDGQSLYVNGGREISIPPDNENHSITLTDQNGVSITEPIRIISTNKNCIPGSSPALVLCIGESTTGTVNPNPFTGSYDSGWNWVSMMKAISEAHGTSVSCLGTETMKGASLQACYTSHGGWSSYTFLNWPCAAKMDPGAPAHFFNSEAMWYALGLQGITGKAFMKEQWQYNLMALTPFGKYPPDNHPSLVAFAKSVSGRHGYPVYCGSIKKWCLSLAKNPMNEFYSLEAAKTGNSAFSLDAYLQRYRTMDNSGNHLESPSENPAGERVRGKDGKYYNIGTRIVSQALLRKVSVCRPTHVVFNVGINDGDSATSTETCAKVLETLLDCFPGIPTAHFVMRWPGACYPTLWAPGYKPRQYSANGNNKRVMAIMTSAAGWAADKTGVYLLDVWHCQSPVSQHEEKYSGGVLDCSLNDVHTGYEGQMSAARQVLGWLYHCLSQGL